MDKSISLDTPKPLLKNTEESDLPSDDLDFNRSNKSVDVSNTEKERKDAEVSKALLPAIESKNTNSKNAWKNQTELCKPKRDIKIMPKPSVGLSIGNILSNGTGRPQATTTYFIVANIPSPPQPSLHIEVPMGKRKTRYKCTECPLIFTHKATWNNHLKKEHQKKRRFACQLCDKDFCGKQVLSNHVKAKHSSEKYHKCPKCEQEFHLKKGLNAHIEQEHRKDKFFSCAECDLQFHLRSTMKTHIKNVHQRGKTFVCVECNATFSWKKALNIHMDAAHRRLPQFRCDQCTSVFRWKSSLAHHVKQAHKPIEMYKFPCFDCTSTFSTANRLNCHRKKVHKDTNEADSRRRREFSPLSKAREGRTLKVPEVPKKHLPSMPTLPPTIQNSLHPPQPHQPVPLPPPYLRGKMMPDTGPIPQMAVPMSYAPPSYPHYNPYYHHQGLNGP